MNFILILFGKLFTFLSQLLNLGAGSTWPGHIALELNPNFIKDLLRSDPLRSDPLRSDPLRSDPRGRKLKIIIIAGTNGKTTTGRLITSIIRENNKTFLQNKAGANLLNGLASTIVRGASLNGKLIQDYLIFESDENALPEVIKQTYPDYVICLNLFRDQLDRYGEIDTIAEKWRESFEKLTNKTTLILNSDDPQIAYLGNKSKVKILYFGLDQKGENETKHGADSTHCPKCTNKLTFSTVFFSHLGIWECPNCHLQRPKPDLSTLKSYPLPGTYNKYNSLAAVLIGKNENIKLTNIENSIKSFKPAFGRQEMIAYKGKSVQLFLSKNPTSFNESLQTIKELGGTNLLILLNDRIPDGLDVSWIWDINFEEILDKKFNIAVSGDRVYDMAVRLKYAQQFTHVEPDPSTALDKMVGNLESEETLYILPNYSAMLEVRKVLTGRKLL